MSHKRVAVNFFESRRIIRVVIAENGLVDRLQKEARSRFVVICVVFYVLDGRVDGGLVHLVGRDAVIQRQFVRRVAICVTMAIGSVSPDGNARSIDLLILSALKSAFKFRLFW